ncbi:malate dehydrogenase [Pseudonocardia broussonetiae]|uniref:Malate dehydrogenase n=1 Tax=Pseudonocardia broussonetiae TaxID=2736640 RepID=A0A6M6JML7_9PSEU|nr:malate dehydrogenase [Pseudonocardia broussonetiae]QJY49218.1 malate dehydrogenase [Pseudonocardia broussonetiae]
MSSRVVGADDVDAAAQAGILAVGPRDVVTPLARERARERGVEIVVATPGTTAAVTGDRRTGSGTSSVPPPRPAPAAPRPSPAGARPPTVTGRSSTAPRPVRPPSGALFRRGAPLPSAVRPGAVRRVIVVGAGNVGTVTAMRLADADVFGEIVLVDVDEGRARGVALDLAHSAALGGFATRVRGCGTVEEAGAADYVVITAGRARQPGMSRADLVGSNAAIVGDVAARAARTSPDAVLVVVTNPLDEMTQHAWQASGLPAERVVGMAGVLDTARFRALVAPAAGDRPDRVRALALGGHGEEMVIPLSQATVGGRPLAEVADGVDAAVDRARGSGAEVVGLLRNGSAFLAPGTAAASMVLAMVRDTGEVLPAAVLADGTYGIRDVYVGLPVRLGRGGVREIVEVDLAPDELTALRAAADRIRERVGALTR